MRERERESLVLCGVWCLRGSEQRVSSTGESGMVVSLCVRVRVCVCVCGVLRCVVFVWLRDSGVVYANIHMRRDLVCLSLSVCLSVSLP